MKKIDELDKKILSLVKDNARIPYLEIARECKVSGAAIHQRMQKMHKSEIYKGAQLILNTEALGYTTCAFLGILLKDSRHFSDVAQFIEQIPEVTECYYTTGRYALFIKLYAQSNTHLLNLIQEKILAIEGISSTETLISLDEGFHRQVPIL